MHYEKGAIFIVIPKPPLLAVVIVSIITFQVVFMRTQPSNESPIGKKIIGGQNGLFLAFPLQKAWSALSLTPYHVSVHKGYCR
ncbi:hypothetical protein VCSRO51_0744 [Vibrio cholerae]|nr:hypothetical protein VCSRO51_0744 [Vibrio cholerae]